MAAASAAITADELATFQKQQAAALRMINNNKIAAEIAAKKLSGIICGIICTFCSCSSV